MHPDTPLDPHQQGFDCCGELPHGSDGRIILDDLGDINERVNEVDAGDHQAHITVIKLVTLKLRAGAPPPWSKQTLMLTKETLPGSPMFTWSKQTLMLLLMLMLLC